MSDRNFTFDILKTIGLLCIILAHVHPSHLIDQLRNFDVPLMVMVSGALFAMGCQNKPVPSLVQYFQKRFVRLVLPVWFFLLFLLPFYYVVYVLLHKAYPYSIKQIVESFLFLEGIGFVWIFRVFLLVALAAPFLLWVYRRVNNIFLYMVALSFVCVINEWLIWQFRFHSVFSGLDFIVENYLLYLTSYGLVFGVGIVLSNLSKRGWVYLMISMGAIFTIIALMIYKSTHHFLPTQFGKYPATIYYLSYAIFMSLLLYSLFSKISFSNNPLKRLITFISTASLWIYLWHIFFLGVWGGIENILPATMNHYGTRFIITVLCSIFVVWVQRLIVFKLIRLSNSRTQKDLTILFLQ